MKLFFIILGFLLIFFIPIPIKLSMYFSTVDYYIKLYKITIFSKEKHKKKTDSQNKKPVVKKEGKLFPKFYKEINFRSLIKALYRINLKFKPLLRIKLSLDYSLNDAARTSIFYGILSQLNPIIYITLKHPFHINKYNIRINPIFEDRFLLKIETSSIIFLSFANIIYITIIFLKILLKQGRWPLILGGNYVKRKTRWKFNV